MGSKFIYEFTLDDGLVRTFTVGFEPKDYDDGQLHAEWTRLGFHQCENCPLKEKDHPYCPVARDIEDVANKFRDIISYERVNVRVITDQREYFKNCDVQTGLKSLLGLIMGASDCPILGQFKSMAYYHLPFSSVDETIFRTVGAYLLKQYFVYKEGEEPDLDLEGLEGLYHRLQEVNTSFLQRIKAASKSDANLNAINILFSLSAMVSMTLEAKLDELKPLFTIEKRVAEQMEARKRQRNEP